MNLRRFKLVVLLMVAMVFVPTLLSAQSTDVPKYSIFGGYSYYHPGGNVDTYNEDPFIAHPMAPAGNGNVAVTDLKKGWAGQFTYNLNRWAGITADVNGHYGDYSTAYSVAAGPQFRLRTQLVQPFAEALVGWQRISPKYYEDQNTATFWVGGGLDYPVGPRFAIRLIQADYVNSYYNKLSPSGTNNYFNGVRLQAGLLYNFGLPKVVNNAAAACSVEPAAVDAGVPVKVLLTASGFNPKRKLAYTYSSNAATKIAATDGVATVETTNLAPGKYTVSGRVSDDGKAPHQATASCSAGFTVNQPPQHPPVLSVSARPASLVSGDASVITASGSSVDNRPLSYSCTSNAGRLTGSGTGYTLDTAGVGAGVVTIHCTVSDDRNLTATASTTVNVSVPPPAPVAREFGKIKFEHDLKRPARVDNEAKGELDRYADALAADPNAKGYVVGYETEKEAAAHKGKKTSSLAAERAVNTKDYLVHEKGVDANRITPLTGAGVSEKTTDLWIVPAGASFPAAGTTVVDEAKVKAVPRTAPAKAKKAAAKK